MKLWLLAVPAAAFFFYQTGPENANLEERLARHRNLGKAFYENPTTQKEAVEEFRKALELAPKSAREQLNHALALLRAGDTEKAIAQLEAVQKQAPELPHTWFNLGIHYKKLGENEKAVVQFEQMVKLVPDDPISHHNLGAVYKGLGRAEDAIREFQTAARLDPNLAAPHFQLFNMLRTTGRAEQAKAELDIFQRLKKQQEGAAIPEDVEWNMYAEVYEVMQDGAPVFAPGPVSFDTRQIAGATGAVPFDLNNDGKAEVLSWAADTFRTEGGATLKTPGIRTIVPGDFDNDAFQDVVVVTDSGPLLFSNTKGALAKSKVSLPAGDFRQALWVDYDHDYDLDLLLLGSKLVLLRNQMPDGFADRSADLPTTPDQPAEAAGLRLVADTKGWDIVLAYRDRPAMVLRDKLGGKFEAQTTEIPAGATSLRAADLDNDGWIDLAFVASGEVRVAWNKNGVLTSPATIAKTEAKTITTVDATNSGLLDLAAGPLLLRNKGKRSFEAAELAKTPVACSASADLNTDGAIDLVCPDSSGLSILTNKTASRGNWVGVQLAGVKNLKLAAASEVEVKTGSRYAKQIYTGLPLVFGLGTHKDVDTVRITWPNGLIQNEVKQAVARVHKYEEAQRLSGSCPMIWTWNGASWEYITDVLGVAPLGATSGDGQYFPVDNDEYIQIPGRSLQERNGEYEIRITEELSEVAYLDKIELLAVDHPASMDLYTNDKFKGPPFPEFRLFGVAKPIAPARALDHEGRDVRAKLLDRDEVYPDNYKRDLSGVGVLHNLDLDFGPQAALRNEAILVLSGWVDWADGSTFLGAAQTTSGGLIPPYLQVKDEGGKWVTVIEDMGMPAGKPKTIVVDLSGKFRSASREVRIVTNLCVYWDRIFLSSDTAAPQHRTRSARTLSADLSFRGFSPVTVHPQRKQPEKFSYASPRPVSMWNPTPGLYTRYGDVKALSAEIDDRMVIMGSGDELRLRFDARALGPVPAGWTRDFLLLVDGWAKDRDPNTAYSQSVEPLPFHGMSQFPYAANERFPDTPAHREWREQYNTRPALRPLRPLRPLAQR